MATTTLIPDTQQQQPADSGKTTFVYDPNRTYSEHPTAPEPTHPDLLWTKTVMRGYERKTEIKTVLKGPDGKPLLDAEGKEVYTTSWKHEKRAQAETQKGDNWAKLEKQKFVKVNENQIKRPSVRSIDAALALVNGDEQRLVEIFNDGLDYNSNSISNQLMTSYVEGTGANGIDAVPLHNDELLELWELLQERKRSAKLTPVEFVMKQLSKLNLPEGMDISTLQEVIARMQAAPQAIAQLKAESASESAEGAEDSSEEEEGEEGEEVPA